MNVLSVTDFITYVNESFRAIWDPTQVTVEGEVSEFRISQGQWVSFNLKDEASMLNCFMVLHNLHIPVEDGMRIRVYGYPRIYPKWGKFSFNTDRVELVGEGALRRALELLRKKLEAEGLFDPSRKRSLPRFPKRIALVASKTSAAYGDFVRIVDERWKGVEIDLYHVLVQGDRAPASIVGAIRRAHERHEEEPYDAMVITRGGGSFEELMAFNDETLARAIYASKIPTLVAVGHERDITIAEEVADVRGSTPTDCARRLVPDVRDILYELSALESKAASGVGSLIEQANRKMTRAFECALHWTASVRHEAEQRSDAVFHAEERWFESLRSRTESLSRFMRSVDPKAVLKRGYAMLTDKNGRVRSRAEDLKGGDAVTIRLHDGSRDATILGEQTGFGF